MPELSDFPLHALVFLMWRAVSLDFETRSASLHCLASSKMMRIKSFGEISVDDRLAVCVIECRRLR